MNTEKAVEMLQCAEINCDNVCVLGAAVVPIIKLQIQEAILALDGSLVTGSAPAKEDV